MLPEPYMASDEVGSLPRRAARWRRRAGMALRGAVRTVQAALLLAGGLLAVATFTPLVPWTARQLTAKWSDSDGAVLIVLSGPIVQHHRLGTFLVGSSYWRAVHAVDAWRRGRFQTILLSGMGSAEAVRPFLVAYGVPEGAIVVEDRSKSTHENAVFARAALAGRSGSFVLLTSDFHTYRAARCFARENIPVVTRPVPDILKRANTLQLRWDCFCELMTELVKIGYYRARGWI